MTALTTAAERQCWLSRSLPAFDGTRDTLLTPLHPVPILPHRCPQADGGEPASFDVAIGDAGSLSEWLA